MCCTCLTICHVRARVQEWSGDISGNAAMKNMRDTAPRERTDYGFRDVIVGGKKQTVLIVDPQNYLANGTVHMETVEAARSLAAAFGIPIGFTVGQSAEMTKANGSQRELLNNYNSLRTDTGTLLINLDSNIPYTNILTSAWCSWLRRADTAVAAEIDRLARRIASLSGMEITAEKAVQQTFSGSRAERTAQAVRMRPDEVLAWIMEYPDTAMAFAHENPSIVRRLCEKMGDVILKAFGKGDDRAASLTAQLQAKLLHTFSRTAEAAESMMHSEPSSRIEQRRGKRKKPLPDDMRLMSINRSLNIPYNEQIDSFYGRNDSTGRSDDIYVMGSDETLESFGLGDRPFFMLKSNLKKSTRIKGNNSHYSSHGISEDIVRKIPEYIKDPAIVIVSEGRISIISDRKVTTQRGEAAPLLIGINPNGIVDGKNANQIKSIYGVDDFRSWLSLRAKDSQILAGNTKKTAALLRDVGLQLPEPVAYATNLTDSIVSQLKTDVNSPEDNSNVKLSRTLRTPTQQESRAWLDDYAEQYGTTPQRSTGSFRRYTMQPETARCFHRLPAGLFRITAKGIT